MTMIAEPAAGQAAQFARDGFTIIPQLFSPDEITEIRDTFMAQAAQGPVAGLSDKHHTLDPNEPLARYPRMMFPHTHTELAVGPVAKKYLLDQRLYDVLVNLFGEEPAAAQSMFYFKPPGARGQDLHQDNFYLRVKPGTCIAAWLAIDDADRDNGGMVVVPGTGDLAIACPEPSDKAKFFTSHHVAPPPGLSETPVDLQAGDVLFFNGSLIHGSYPNESRDRFRRALIFHYVPRASAELAKYHTIAFDGTVLDIPAAQGGGPCGAPIPATPH